MRFRPSRISSVCGNKGFTLVELITVMAVMGILLAIATLNFSLWRKKSNIDRQMNEMAVDINSARLSAIYKKSPQGVLITSNSYVLKNYSSENEDTDAGRVEKSVAPVYRLTPESGSFTADPYMFNIRGLLSNSLGVTITTMPTDTGANDCIVLSVGRTNVGKMKNGNCVF